MSVEFKNISVTKHPPIIEFCINKTYAYVNNEKEMPEPSDIRLIIKPKFNETGYSNIEEIKKDLKFIFEQASKYFD